MKRFLPFLLLVACGGGEEPWVAPNGTIVVDRQEIRFGNVVAGESALDHVQVKNPGPDTVPIFWRLEPEDAQVDVWMPRFVEGFETITVDVRLAPERSEPVRADLVLTDGLVEHRVALRGTARECPVVIEPLKIELPVTYVGERGFAPYQIKNYAKGETGIRISEGTFCPHSPYFWSCVSPPGDRVSIAYSAGRIMEGETIEERGALIRPLAPGRVTNDIRLEMRGCSLVIESAVEARWGDLECNFGAMSQLPVLEGCDEAQIVCRNRTDRTIAISGWSTGHFTNFVLPPSVPFDLAPDETFSIPVSYCGWTIGLVEIHGDFERPRDVVEVVLESTRP